MAGPSPTSELTADSDLAHTGETIGNLKFALVSLTSLFFIWGFITSLNDILIPYLKSMFQLNYAEAMLIQFCFFGAYFIVSVPAGALVRRVGYQKGIVYGLLLSSLGCLLFYPAASMKIYVIFLSALFILAAGITLLQVAANPFVSVLGDPKTASSRLTMTQAFNSLGTTVGPLLIGPIILAALLLAADGHHTASQQAFAVQLPYLVLAATLFVLAIIFAIIKLPNIGHSKSESHTKTSGSAWQHRHLVLGAVAIFVYVGAEVGIGSFIVNFLSLDSIASMTESEASKYISFYFGGAMVGRFIGAAVMRKIDAGKSLAFNAICATILLGITIATSGSIAMWSVLFIGLFNSIMFPTIFTLAIAGLKQHTSQGSGILCLAIVGGAILPLLQGILADATSIQTAYFIPLLCFIYIAYYGLVGSKPAPQREVE